MTANEQQLLDLESESENEERLFYYLYLIEKETKIKQMHIYVKDSHGEFKLSKFQTA